MNRSCLTSVACACVLLTGALADATADNTVHFSAEAYGRHVEYLASDTLGGRGVDSPGIEAAADYIARQWAEAGLKPGGVDGTWFQPFDVPARKTLIADDAQLTFEGAAIPAKLREDWTPLPFTGLGDASGPLAFVGYGIEAPDQDYDDYLDIDARGKVLLMFRYEPAALNEKRDDETVSSRHSYFRQKAETAARLGAKAVLIVNPPNHPDGVEDVLMAFEPWQTRPTYDVPMAQVSRKLADALLAAAKLPDCATLQKQLDAERESLSAEIPGITVSLKSGVRPARTRNVVGFLPGDGTTDEVIVIGAHYDHLGTQPTGRGESASAIFNGADDNASGTAGLIELARRLAQLPPPKRGILFIAFSSEELGLYGSKHFVAEPTIPLARIKAMMNFDMIGRYEADRFAIYGAYTAREFADWVKEHETALGFEAKKPREVPPNSDHGPFADAGIPVLFPFTGLHEDYHQPSDDFDKIDAEAATRVLEFGARMLLTLANAPEAPTPTFDAPAATEDDDADAPSRRRARVRLGFFPKLDAPEPGVFVERVVSGGPGAVAGLKVRDQITKIGATEIKTMADYREATAELSPGDEVEMQVLREGETVTLTVKFTAIPLRREPT